MSVKLDEPSSSMQYPIRKEPIFQDLKQLEPLDEILRCRICFEYFNVCMMTACSHNYCSLCIRKYMTYKAQCPTCFQETSEPELRNNRLIDEIVKAYKIVRESCELLCQGYCRSSSDENFSTDSKSQDQRNVTDDRNMNTSSDHIIELSQPSATSQNKVCCPVCSVSVFEKNINLHLDSCLQQKENVTAPSPSKEKRMPLPKVVYHLMADKDLRKKLKECGLSNAGDRQALIRRHKNFLVIYNSECDSEQPRSVADIIKQVEVEEMVEKKFEKSKKVFEYDKKSDTKVIEEQQRSYLRQHSQQFKDLVEDVHLRRQQNALESGQCSDKSTLVSSKSTELITDSSDLEEENMSFPCSTSKSAAECPGSNDIMEQPSSIGDSPELFFESDVVQGSSGEDEVIILDEEDELSKDDVIPCENVSSADSLSSIQKQDNNISRKY